MSALAASAIAALAAAAVTGAERLDAAGGVVVSSSRVLGLAGAYAAVGEGLDGAAQNPAAVAHRERHLERGWDWDFVVAWYLPPPQALAGQDPTNQGHTWGQLSGMANAQVGLSAQLGRLGLGVVLTSWQLEAPNGGGTTLRAGTGDAALHLGWSGWGDELVLGATVGAAAGSVELDDASGRTRLREYSGGLLRAGALWRPRGLPFRVGLAASPPTSARPEPDPGLPFATPSAMFFPARVSLGAALWIGPGARLLNEPSPAAARQLGLAAREAVAEAARTPVLLSLQLDLVGRSPAAVGMEALLPGGPGAAPAGGRATVAVRAGAEWEALLHRLAVRGGAWLEPSRGGAAPRPHLAFGADLRFRLLWDLRVGIAGDLARRYQNISLSLGLWRSAGPQAVPGEG